MKTLRCECTDPACPCCHGSCDRKATYILYRMDTEDETGTPMCQGCADDAMSSGLFAIEEEDLNEPQD